MSRDAAGIRLWVRLPERVGDVLIGLQTSHGRGVHGQLRVGESVRLVPVDHRPYLFAEPTDLLDPNRYGHERVLQIAREVEVVREAGFRLARTVSVVQEQVDVPAR